jgi:hypothetical protein
MAILQTEVTASLGADLRAHQLITLLLQLQTLSMPDCVVSSTESSKARISLVRKDSVAKLAFHECLI